MKLKRYDIYSEDALIDQESDNGDYVIYSLKLQILADKDEIKPITIKGKYNHCPHCDIMFLTVINNYCDNCGQRLGKRAVGED